MGCLVPMLLRAFTLQDRMAAFTPSMGNSPQPLLVPEPHLGVSGEALSVSGSFWGSVKWRGPESSQKPQV